LDAPKPEARTVFDLTSHAEKRRYRLRNLHDGRLLHPLRVPVSARGRSEGHVGKDDRMDAIIGQHGYVTDEGGGRIGWYVFSKTNFGVNSWLPRLGAAGAEIKQVGDGEAAGHAPAEAIGAILGIVRPFRKADRPDRRTDGCLIRRRVAARGDATASGRVSAPPETD
jgi:hypothetical protein